ncbi:MAG: SpoIIE family protein phosphatase [Candidatus Korobacteraceae bacterium]
MEIASTEYIPITDASSIGEARRRGLLMAEKLGFDEVRAGEFALLITEVTRNVLNHAQTGQTILMGLKNAHGAIARVLALDNGPGISNVARAMDDGYSTGGTPGGGLGAMKRMATGLEIFTSQNGTIVLLEIGGGPAKKGLQIAGMAVPYPGERVCGDAWAFHQSPERCAVLLVDGLGHGHLAAEAADEAIHIFQRRVELAPGEILSYVHDGLKKTRGAVAAVAEIRPAEKLLTYAGVGNTAASLVSNQGSRSLVSHSGTLGVAASPHIQEFRVEWPDDGILIMHSDGLTSRWDLSTYSGLLARHPAVIGGALLRDYRRQRDDASVVVVKAAA